jgi:alcohol dehydrogenase (cytochrome c)
MVRSRYGCGVIAACAAVAAATLVLRAQQPAAQTPTPTQLPGPPAPGAPLFEPPPMPAILKQYQTISADRLKNPPDADWPMVRRTYDGWGYSPLSQIDADNVKRLQPAWIFSTGAENGHERLQSSSTASCSCRRPAIRCLRLMPEPGTLLWRYRRPLPTAAVVLHPTSRGIAVYGDKVYFAAGEAVLVALDAKTGDEVWTTPVADNASGYYMSLAPLVADGKVLIGTSGGELGIRGYVSAFDAETGKELWKTYMVPGAWRAGQ